MTTTSLKETSVDTLTYEAASQQLLHWLDQPTPVARIEADVAAWPNEALEGLQVGLVMALADPAFDANEQRDIVVMIWAIGNEDAKRRGRDVSPFPQGMERR